MKTILVVDDDYLLVEALTDLLELEGYRVVSAANGKDGLAQLVKESPGIVLTDFMMPVADGLDLIWGVHALPKFRAPPMIMRSASRQVALSTYLKARPVRLSAFLSKPFQMDKLLAIVERLIGNGEPQGKAVPGAV
jgi:CheY-like chemotaxis protein